MEQTPCCWWVQRKTRDVLQLWPHLDYEDLAEGSFKVQYAVALSPGAPLADFAVEELTAWRPAEDL